MVLFSAIINGDQKEQQKVRALRRVQGCDPSRSGCWWDGVVRPDAWDPRALLGTPRRLQKLMQQAEDLVRTKGEIQ